MYKLFYFEHSDFGSTFFLLNMRCTCTVLSILTLGRKVLCLNNWNVAVCNMPVRVNILPAPILL